MIVFLMIRRPPRSTRTDTRFPYTAHFRSAPDWSKLLPGRERPWPLSTSPLPRAKPWLPGCRPWWTCRRCRSEEHTSELQSLMRISYAVFCLKKKKSIRIYVDYVVHFFCHLIIITLYMFH